MLLKYIIVLMSLFAWNCCISVQAGIGSIAINDFLLIEATIYKLLKKHVSHKPYYVDVLDLFHEVSACYMNVTTVFLDMRLSKSKLPLGNISKISVNHMSSNFFVCLSNSNFTQTVMEIFWRQIFFSATTTLYNIANWGRLNPHPVNL